MRSLTTSGYICLKDDYGLTYKVARIDYIEWEDGHFKYSFYPFYNVINILPNSLFQGIPGLDLSLEEAVYERENMVPVFIAERTPSERREDVWQLLEESGMQALNRLEWLMKSNKRYSGDRFFVIPISGNETIRYRKQSMYELVKRSDNLIKKLLGIICFGDYLESSEIVIDDTTRGMYYRLFLPMYIREYENMQTARKRGIENAKQNNVYKGREQIKIDPLLFQKVRNDYVHGKISADYAANILGISKSTFFRRIKGIY